jgi:energy-coupling factor transporter ATP-binding protein EcfA2
MLVAIAGVLAMLPQVLVFDEPSAQLDPRSRRQLIQLLATLPQTQVIATHDPRFGFRTMRSHSGVKSWSGGGRGRNR